MMTKQERMRQGKEEETRLEIRTFKAARLGLGSNKAIPSIAVGGITLVRLG